MGELVEALLLGIIQGLTEFLPVSSDGHLALAGMLFGVENAGLTLNVLLHAGTLVATAIVLRQRVLLALTDAVRALRKPELFRTTPGGRDALFVLVATVPTGVIGLLLRDRVEAWSVLPLPVGLGFLVTTLFLLSTLLARPGAEEGPTLPQAVLVGCIQGLAVLPGVSRSGGTIALLLFLGVARSRAFELSMLMSLPAVLGAVILEVPHMIEQMDGLGSALFGTAAAFGVGLVALVVLRRVVVGGRFAWFALWTAPLAVATLAMARAWP